MKKGKRRTVNYNRLHGQHYYACSNEKCHHNEVRMNEEITADRKIMCAKCNAGYLISKAKKQQQSGGYVIQTGKKTGVRVKAGEKTRYEKSFGKWKQARVSDGVSYPVHKYNIKDKKTEETGGDGGNDFDDVPW